MAEIAFRVGPTVKWISGINEQTTCKDILVSLLRTEGVLPGEVEEEENIHHNFALVERWREVSKVLPPTSLILKIWTAWGEEQDCVSFTVKRVKRNPKEVEGDEPGVGRRRVRRRNSKAGDTLHPRALAREREKDLQQQMKKIINQGEKIRRHLVTLKAEVGATGQRGDEDGHPQNLVDPVEEVEPILHGRVSSTYAVDPVLAANSEEGTDSGNVTEGSETGEVDKEGVLEEEKAGGDTKEANETALKSEAKTVVSSTEEGTDVDENDVRDLIEMLEKLHRINKVLESKEEQILTMKFECEALTEGTETLEAPNPTFNREVGEYRRVNAALLRNIADNSTMLRGLKEESEERKKEVARLEFDVNLIERESKRLESDLVKVKSIGCRANIGQVSPGELQSKSGIMLRDGPARGRNIVEGSPTKIYGTRSEVQAGMYNNTNNNTSDSLSGHQAAPTVAQPSKRLPQMDQQQARPSHNPANADPHSPKTAPDMALPLLQGPAISPSSPIHSTCDPLVDPTQNPSAADDRASPPGSSRGSDKSVRFNDRENVLRFCSTASSASLSPPPLLLPVLSPRSILKCVKGGYGSDSGSDTGVSSLSSMQGDYELSTLV